MSAASQPDRAWTIMMYIAADGMLANFAVESLKQLVRATSDKVVVVAQFDADGESDIPRLVFKGPVSDRTGSLDPELLALSELIALSPSDQKLVKPILEESIDLYRQDRVRRGTNMADPRVLSDFIDWAYDAYKAQRYSLIFWGHGPELLFDEFLVPSTGKKSQSFLTPTQLRKALADTKLAQDQGKAYRRTFDVIGIDACNMSNLEISCELKDHADFLIASQEEVPDFSLPYDMVINAFGDKVRDPEIITMCKEIPLGYALAYRNFVLTKETKTESISLSSLSLQNVDKVTDPLARLVTALENAMNHEHHQAVRKAIVEARANSKGFVAGLYVDVCDFCEELRTQLFAKKIDNQALVQACKDVCYAVGSRDDHACVIQNCAPQDQRCHGLSLYFPYLTDAEREDLSSPLAPLVKGSRDAPTKGSRDAPTKGSRDAPTKGSRDAPTKIAMDLLNKAGTDVLDQVRRQRIEETELYYGDLELSKKTHWHEFIEHHWSRCLAEDAEEQVKVLPDQDASEALDLRYSAQQCALNLLSLVRKLERKKHEPPGGSPGGSGLSPALREGLEPAPVEKNGKNGRRRATYGAVK